MEEVAPFIHFLLLSREFTLPKIERYASEEQLVQYATLTDEILQQRLLAEHERAVKIDDKTSKFTLGFSISLTVISVLSNNIVKIIPIGRLGDYISPIFIVSSIYMLASSLISLGSLKTLPRYGYGTAFEIDKSKSKLANAVICQERINNLRHARNEAAFMSLRNGCLLIFAALVLCALALIMKLLP